MAKKSGKRIFTPLLPPIPFGHLNFDALSDRLDDRAIRSMTRISRDLYPDSLPEQFGPFRLYYIWILAFIPETQSSVRFFTNTGSWIAGMTSNDKSPLPHPSALGLGDPIWSSQAWNTNLFRSAWLDSGEDPDDNLWCDCSSRSKVNHSQPVMGFPFR
jgi:hypothetical protein